MGGGLKHIRVWLSCAVLVACIALAGPAAAQETVITLGSGHFTAPTGVAVDGAGNVFVVDNATSELQEIAAADGAVTQLAAANGNFLNPQALAIDSSGNLYVADTGNNVIKQVLAAGGYTVVNTFGNLGGATISQPTGLAFDGSGNLFVAGGGFVTVFSPSDGFTNGTALNFTSSGPTPPPTPVPNGIAFDGAGNMFITDLTNRVLDEVNAADLAAFLSQQISGIPVTELDAFPAGQPFGVAVEGRFQIDEVFIEFVTDQENGAVNILNGRSPTDLPGPYNGPTGITFDAAGNIYVADTGDGVIKEVVRHSMTVLAPPTSPVAFGTSVTFTATITGASDSFDTPDGIVTFLDNGAAIGTGDVISGVASFSTAALEGGSHSITAQYGGSIGAAYAPSTTAAVTQVVTPLPTTTSLGTSLNPALPGQTITFTATSTGVGGSVSFADGSTSLATVALVNGSATFTTSSLAKGSHSITASYGGTADYQASAPSPLIEAIGVNTTQLISSANPSVAGQSVTFTAFVDAANGVPTGSVSFLDGAISLGSATLANGLAQFTTSSLSAGPHSITAQYGGDDNFDTSTSDALSQTVTAAPLTTTQTALAAAPNPSIPGQNVTLTATVTAGSGTPTGSVTFQDGTTMLGTVALSGGTASLGTTSLSLGSHSITAAYAGGGGFAASTSASVTESVSQPTSTVTLSASADPSLAGQSVTFTALVASSGSPTGSVTFYDGATSLGTGTLAGGLAKLSTASLTVGSHSIIASYGGDANATGSNSTPLIEIVEANSTAGQVYGYQTTLGVTGTAGADAAHFNGPAPGAVDAAGHHLFVADTGNHRVQVLDTATLAVVATIGTAGEAGSDNSHFDHPGGVAFDASSRHLFVVDTGNQRLQIFSADDFSYLTTFGTTGAVSFDAPSNAFASTVTNQLYVADTGNHRVLVFSLSGLGLTATLGTSGTAGSDNAHFDAPQDAELDPSTNAILVADTGNRRIQVFDATSFAYVMTLGETGVSGSDNTHFAQPVSADFDPASNLVLVADGGANARLQVFDGMSYQYVLTLGAVGSAGPGNSQFASPHGIVADAAQSRLFIGDAVNDRVQVFAIAPIVTEASVLPGSRSVQLGSPATIFASVVNAGTTALDECRIALPITAPAGLTLDYQTTDPATNALTGRPDMPATIPGAGGVQSFLVTLRSSATLATTTLPLDFDCSGAAPATVVTGLDTVDLSVASTPVPDIIALAATASGNGIVQTTPGIAGPFAVASANVGATAPITVSADTGDAQLFVQVLLCQTNPSTGQCLAPPSASTTLDFAAGATPTFSVFIEASGTVPLDPAHNRVFVRFKDAGGALHGSTSVAFAALPG